MAASFFFYDLETSGIDPRTARIMQFAGQRTDMDLQPIGEPVNELIALSPDILPDPDAILLTGISPQQTVLEGQTEAQFLELFYKDVVQPDTIFVGFNSIRFDDEFMRFLHWRNYYDAYEWQWQHGCSRWDILDTVRMTRALRPEGMEWPFASDGKPTNRLELLTAVNKLDHAHAHDALGDVLATIAVARKIKNVQPDLFSYLLEHRSKKAVSGIVNSQKAFVYTTGHFSSSVMHTSPVIKLVDHPQNDTALVYDLRQDPTPFLAMTVDEIIDAWKYSKDPDVVRLPVKTLKFNRCPAVAPLGVISDPKTQKLINISMDDVQKHLAILQKHQKQFAELMLQAVAKLDEIRMNDQVELLDDPLSVDSRLYDNFITPTDKIRMNDIRHAKPDEFYEIGANFQDQRLINLLPLYKARNYPKSLDPEERQAWDAFCAKKLLGGDTKSRAVWYFATLQDRVETIKNPKKQYILEELRLYGESILPVDVAD